MKRRFKLTARIPPYRSPRNLWRSDTHEVLSAEAQKASIKYKPSDRLQIAITLYMPASALHSHDVDNRLKDIMDALQGRTGGSKKIRLLNPIIPNDRQIYRVTIEKKTPPKQSKGLGHITISKYGDV